MPVSQDIERGWFHGLSHQEAPQANGQEEAPQAAAEDPGPAQEQEVAQELQARGAGVPARLPGRLRYAASPCGPPAWPAGSPAARRGPATAPRGRHDEPASGGSGTSMAAAGRGRRRFRAPACGGRLRGRRVRIRPRFPCLSGDAAVPGGLPAVVPRPHARAGARAGRRPGAGRGEPLRGPAVRRDHAPHGALRRTPKSPEPAPARRRPRLCDPRPGEPGHEERAHQGPPGGGRAAACRGRARRGVPRGLQGNREALQRAVPAAAIWPRRVCGDRDTGRRADHPVRDRRRRGDLSNDR